MKKLNILSKFTPKINYSIISTRTTTTHFGFQEVDEKDKEKKVHTVFANVASKYDLMNDAMSLGIHRLWKDYFIQRLNPTCNTKMLDVAGGTGDIAFRALKMIQKRNGTGNVTILDINQNMLDVGKMRAEKDESLDKSKLKWECGNAELLPFEDNTFDLYTIAFGIRNCTHVDKVLREAYRVLRPDGKLAVLEFSQIAKPLSPLYDFYSFNIIPVLGEILASDYNSYKYLVESIRKFPNQEEFAKMIKDEGFEDVTYENLNLGICSIHTGIKKK
ncbi:2-methoxy-6-polyprenyl-1,4-benzoquinol methylase, mitochondrial [Strongyloides ratti]|uniref:2-methoxy-6-polyprenyl-1,4-benzoquinol methylase, mitochondrial n=1 Tax=Strongyloides ratti TaxID=34506 RepID=A0A090L9E0_STRRB|nr:2-methoxy-6-polyprenyl-1,4-benzoquinol methylase, mitochondrial [Strongyloides ratti]CEF64723.1 2-methoxy-6-polyprenyl-1,4-benzoquinol methylase, mitochondrial [Strongyloides ratti]